MLQVLPVIFGTLSNIQIVHYASNISCLKGGKVFIYLEHGRRIYSAHKMENRICYRLGTESEYEITIGCLNSDQLVITNTLILLSNMPAWKKLKGH